MYIYQEADNFLKSEMMLTLFARKVIKSEGVLLIKAIYCDVTKKLFFQTAHVHGRGCFHRSRIDQNFQPLYAHYAQLSMLKINCAVFLQPKDLSAFLVEICSALYHVF